MKNAEGAESEANAKSEPQKPVYDEAQILQQQEYILKINEVKKPMNKEEEILELKDKLQLLVTNLVGKIQKKHESLMLSQQ